MIIVLSAKMASDPVEITANNVNHPKDKQTTVSKKFPNQENMKEMKHDDILSKKQLLEKLRVMRAELHWKEGPENSLGSQNLREAKDVASEKHRKINAE